MQDRFEDQVEEQIERLRGGSLQRDEVAVSEKRRIWLQGRTSRIMGPPSPRDAYDLFLLKYLDLAEDEVPVVSEAESEIVWHSFNACPTLEACNRVGLDTRVVCRRVYEKSTQAFISQLDPQLRFWRSYEEIRPRSPYCKEGITRIDFERMMRLAIEEGKISRREGNKGYGAVLVLGKEILTSHDTVSTDGDPSLHAEVNVIRDAVRRSVDPNLCGGVLFCTCEPCTMCASLAAWANLTTIVYGASIEETARLGKSRILISSREVAQQAPVSLEVIAGVLRDDCMALYR